MPILNMIRGQCNIKDIFFSIWKKTLCILFRTVCSTGHKNCRTLSPKQAARIVKTAESANIKLRATTALQTLVLVDFFACIYKGQPLKRDVVSSLAVTRKTVKYYIIEQNK